MADAHAKQHDYHLVDPSPWPIVGSVAALVLAVGLISWMHKMYAAAPVVFAAGAIGVLYTMYPVRQPEPPRADNAPTPGRS